MDQRVWNNLSVKNLSSGEEKKHQPLIPGMLLRLLERQGKNMASWKAHKLKCELPVAPEVIKIIGAKSQRLSYKSLKVHPASC